MKVDQKGCSAYVRSNTEVKDTVGPLVKSDGLKVSDHEKMCNILGQFLTQGLIVGKLPEVIKTLNVVNGCKISNADITKEDRDN
jgi:hypothetical protein